MNGVAVLFHMPMLINIQPVYHHHHHYFCINIIIIIINYKKQLTPSACYM
jgi:hypothetical protein